MCSRLTFATAVGIPRSVRWSSSRVTADVYVSSVFGQRFRALRLILAAREQVSIRPISTVFAFVLDRMGTERAGILFFLDFGRVPFGTDLLAKPPEPATLVAPIELIPRPRGLPILRHHDCWPPVRVTIDEFLCGSDTVVVRGIERHFGGHVLLLLGQRVLKLPPERALC